MGCVTCGSGDQWHLVSFSSYPNCLGYVSMGPMGPCWRQSTSVLKPEFIAVLGENILSLEKEFGVLFKTKEKGLLHCGVQMEKLLKIHLDFLLPPFLVVSLGEQ